MEYTIIVNGVRWPTPAIDGIKVDNKYMLADAERTQGGMHFEKLGEVLVLEITYPSLTQEEYTRIYNSLKPFVVSVTFFNPYSGKQETHQFYRSDLSLSRYWKHIHNPMTITLTGTEIL